MSKNPILSKRVLESLNARNEAKQWERLIGNLLRRLELNATERANAEADYNLLADHIAAKLSVARHDVHIFPQGSMRTQTTISQRYPALFDLDVVVKLTEAKYAWLDPDTMFAAFGQALKGNEKVTGVPEAKRRCWRLPYPGKAYYFDVTPAVPDRTGRAGSSLSVRDPDTGWAPSNPEEFADWFCTHAQQRFPFQLKLNKAQVEGKTAVDPLPDDDVALDDILRRSVQLMKLHRDTVYWGASDEKKEAMPISIIIVTLAAKVYAELLATRSREFKSPIEVVLALVEAMPNHIERTAAGWRVENPKLIGENFADKWNTLGSTRHAEFMWWHDRLQNDLDALLHQNVRTPSDEKIRSVFGAAGLEAWKASKPKANVLDGLVTSAAGYQKTNPDRPLRTGSSNTLG